MTFVTQSIDCQCDAFKLAAGLLERPWTATILTLLQEGPQRFSAIAERARGLGDKVLSARLKELQARGIVERRVEPGPPVRVAYELTARGHAFSQVARAVELWGRELDGERFAEPARSEPSARAHAAGPSSLRTQGTEATRTCVEPSLSAREGHCSSVLGVAACLANQPQDKQPRAVC